MIMTYLRVLIYVLLSEIWVTGYPSVVEGSKNEFSGLVKQMKQRDIPLEFDAREHWKECPQIGQIGDQASCGSCWAISAASAISDRICIATQGGQQVQISAIDALSCIGGFTTLGCKGGTLPAVWHYWVTDGLVTGGQYGDTSSCKPYPFEPCGHFTNVSDPYPPCNEQGQNWDDRIKILPPTPECKLQCQNQYNTSYNDDKHFGTNDYSLHNEISAMADILKHGPLTAFFFVYSDFVHYKSGVYRHKSGRIIYGHVVKVIGWGIEDHLPYWLVVNSWNKYWGDEGYFKIIIDGFTAFHAGIPNTDSYYDKYPAL